MFIKCLLLFLYVGLLDGFGASYYPGRRPSAGCFPPSIVNGKFKLRQRGRMVKFQCNANYTLVGSRYSTCSNGRWDEQLPVCIRAGCQVMPIENGIPLGHEGDAWVSYFCLPGYTLVGSRVVYCNGFRWNATAPTCVDKNQPTQLSCDFESEDLCGWKQDDLHQFDWERMSKKTPSHFLFTGPSWDHTLGRGNNGHYMYIESSSKSHNDTARLISPVYDTSLAKNGCFSFYYHMYGMTCGGLRVYQKPDNMPLETLLFLSDDVKKNYILFEKWGEIGDIWLHSVANLTDYDDDFQIIIEGVRGRSYTGDIAIDDVSMLQGEKCFVPDNPSIPVKPDSCEGRCDPAGASDSMCGCAAECYDNNNCCRDYFDVCVFMDSTPEKGSEIPPHTQKLINSSSTGATWSTVAETTSTTTSTTSTTTPKPTTTTPKPTTTTPKPTTTTPKPTTTTTTKPTTTTPKPTTQKITTTSKPTQKATTQKPPNQKTTKQVVTTKPVVKTTQKPTKVTFTTLSTEPTKITTTAPKTTTDKRKIHDEAMRKEKKEKTIELKKLIKDERKGSKAGMSGWTVTVITFGVLMSLVGFVWFAMAARSERGRIVLSRLRGRIRNDAEVRFLSANMEED